jgi:hypothetical protein
MPHKAFDRSQLRLLPLSERQHDLDRSCLIYPDGSREPFEHAALPVLADRILAAKARKASIIFVCGAHVLRKGAGPLLIDLMKRGLLTHLALNGAGMIHDFEMALIGRTSESVARYVSQGQFGLWEETGQINEVVRAACGDGLGLGETVGRAIDDQGFPYRDTSVLAAGYRLRVPVTVHVSIGQDIIHEYPNFDPAAAATASYADFLVFTQSVAGLEGGVFLNIGSAVMGPEVYLKALAMTRNVARQREEVIQHFTTAVFDLVPLDGDLRQETSKNLPSYYFRPYKTILVRTVADGGDSYYVCGDHALTVPALYDQIIARVDA